MIETTMAWVMAALETALGVTVIKGFPNWSRLPVVPPMASAELWGLNDRSQQRVGQVLSLSVIPIRVVLFGANEPDLWRLAQLMGTWLETGPEYKLNGYRHMLRFVSCERYDSQTEAEQERYGLQFTLAAGWNPA